MQDVSSILFGIIETSDVLFAGVRCYAQRVSSYVGNCLGSLLRRVNHTLFQSSTSSLVRRQEVAILYFGRTSEFLVMTSERMVIPARCCTLGQLLGSLHKRGGRWAEELDDSHLQCTVNGQEAWLFDPIAPGDEVCLSSKKSIFEG